MIYHSPQLYTYLLYFYLDRLNEPEDRCHPDAQKRRFCEWFAAWLPFEEYYPQMLPELLALARLPNMR